KEGGLIVRPLFGTQPVVGGLSPPSVFLPRSFRRLHLRDHRRINRIDEVQFRAANTKRAANFPFDLGRQIRILANEHLRVLASLAEADVAVREPGAGLFDDLVLDADVDELAGLRDALAVTYVELRVPERRGAFV